jgi:hypothetical protein
MSNEIVKIADRFHNLLCMPKSLLLKFEEYESIVNEQLFSLLDRIQEKIEVDSYTVIFNDDKHQEIYDLQIWPSHRSISFKISSKQMSNQL